MSKVKKVAKPSSKENAGFLNTFSLDKFIPSKFQIPVFALIILVIFLLFYSPLYFGGKTFNSADILTSKSLNGYVEHEREGYTLWNPYVFGGMPAYALATGYKWFNVIWVTVGTLRSAFTSFFNNDYAKWTFYLLVLSYTMFAFVYYRTKNVLISLFSAIAVSFSTGIIAFVYIGHVTKLTALCMFPLIFLMLFNFQNRIRLLDILILIITLNIFILGWHVQIIFYTLFAVGIFFLFNLIRALRNKEKKELPHVLKSAGAFIVAMIFALLIQADNFTQIYEYAPYSTRGTKGVLETESNSVTQNKSDFYKYATDWSFSPGEVLTFIIPSYYGFGKSTYVGPLTQGQPYEVSTYFGQMPFVDVAQYMGVLIFFFALFSMYANRKDPFVQFLTILSAIALLISFGRTFSLAFDLMFNYFPFFDKFRVPSMILILVQMSLPILAALGISKIITMKSEHDIRSEKLIQYSAIIFSALFILGLLLSEPIRQWFIGRASESGEKGQQLKPLYDYMADMFAGDFRVVFFISAASFGLAYAYLKNKVSADVFVIALIIFMMFDLFRIDQRAETYTDNSEIEKQFEKPEYLKALDALKDKSTYRILNLKQDRSLGSVSQNSNFNMNFLVQDIYGYSAIKPRAYQDYMDVLQSPANPTFWRMLNVKYIIADQEIPVQGLTPVYNQNKNFIYRNEDALPRAYFVNTVEVKKPIEILNAVKNNQFDPKQVTYLEEPLSVDIPDSTAFVKLTSYKDENIKLDVKASGNNFLFLGDTYFPKGWNATIDGKETKIYRANHGFRGIVVLAGEHKVEFNYLPQSFVISKYVALSLSSLVVLGLVVGLFFEWRKKSRTT